MSFINWLSFWIKKKKSLIRIWMFRFIVFSMVFIDSLKNCNKAIDIIHRSFPKCMKIEFISFFLFHHCKWMIFHQLFQFQINQIYTLALHYVWFFVVHAALWKCMPKHIHSHKNSRHWCSVIVIGVMQMCWAYLSIYLWSYACAMYVCFCVFHFLSHFSYFYRLDLLVLYTFCVLFIFFFFIYFAVSFFAVCM